MTPRKTTRAKRGKGSVRAKVSLSASGVDPFLWSRVFGLAAAWRHSSSWPKGYCWRLDTCLKPSGHDGECFPDSF